VGTHFDVTAVEVTQRGGAFAPLRQPVFRALWIAVLVANVGIWMQGVAAAWEMTTLSRSPALVALVQTATSLPVVIASLPAGVLADILDRRHMLVVCQLWMALSATVLAVLAVLGWLTPAWLLVFTFCIGLGLATWGPAWMATFPEVIPRRDLPAAVVLGGVSFNVARAIGPAIGGLLLALAGASAVFALNALLTLAVAVGFARYVPRRRPSTLPPEHVVGGMLAGGRYVRFSPELRRVLWRAALFMFAGSALWALLPLVARGALGLGSSGYGLLLASLGIGAVVIVPALSDLRARVAPDVVAAASVAAYALGTLALALALPLALTCVLLGLAGAGWTSTLGVFSTSAQQLLPAWVRARALAYYLLTIQGALAVGAAVWGWLAERTDPRTALLASIGALVVSIAASALRPLRSLLAEPLPATPWPEPLIATAEPEPAEGPVLISVPYDVPADELPVFLAAMRDIQRLRRRDGAVNWRLYREVGHPERYSEVFETRSWEEHLRQHARSTLAEAPLERELERWRAADARHLVAEDPGRASLLQSAS
jgi:MFS family permease